MLTNLVEILAESQSKIATLFPLMHIRIIIRIVWMSLIPIIDHVTLNALRAVI